MDDCIRETCTPSTLCGSFVTPLLNQLDLHLDRLRAAASNHQQINRISAIATAIRAADHGLLPDTTEARTLLCRFPSILENTDKQHDAHLADVNLFIKETMHRFAPACNTTDKFV